VHAWTKSACVVLAWGITLILAAVGITASARPAEANIRIASSTHITLTTTTSVATPASAATSRTATYVVQPGDTLSGIAARFALRGGWQALYAANEMLIGSDPSLIQPRMVLVLPGPAPVRCTVAPGDTLSGIAAALGIPGGWQALYAANRPAIGANPNLIEPGTTLTIPALAHPVPSGSSRNGPRRPVRWPGSVRSPSEHLSAPTGTSARRHRSATEGAEAPVGTEMPRWLTDIMVTAALIIAVALVAEPIGAFTRRRRRVVGAPGCTVASCISPSVEPESHQPVRVKPQIMIADYHQLVVSYRAGDDTIYVLRPPGADRLEVLRVARLVLEEDPYQALADRLGVSDPCYRADGPDADRLRSDSTRAAT
jgi:LysM repeat protein